MNIQIQSVHFDADHRLVEFVEAKMAKLDRLIERATDAEVTLRLDKDHEKGNKVAVIKLNVPSDELLAEGRNRSFEEAFDEAFDAIKTQIERYKDVGRRA